MNLKKICPSCGRSDIEFIGSLCKDCYLKNNKFMEAPGTIEIVSCKNCDWIRGGSVENVVKSKVKTKTPGDLTFKGDKIEFEAEIDGVKIKEELPVKIKFIKRFCEECGRIKSGYYEGIIQIRNDQIEKIIDNLQKNTFISKIEKQKNGADVYTGSTKQTKKTLRKMGLKFSESKKLYGMRKGRNLYRTTFLVR
jgi:nonsense-mediated mRNA decay protein 3